MAPRTFALLFGIVYVLVALIEVILKPQTQGFLFYTLNHNLIHWATGILGLLAYSQGEEMSRLYAQVFGIVFLLVAILGFMPSIAEGFLADLLGYTVNTFYNIVHLVTGLLGIWVGFMGSKEQA